MFELTVVRNPFSAHYEFEQCRMNPYKIKKENENVKTLNFKE